MTVRKRAAEYVRMSKDHQLYPTENQATVIRKYAVDRGYEIVRTYADEGKSGLSLGGRDAFQRLLDDVQAGRADYTAVLVYDVMGDNVFNTFACASLRLRPAGPPRSRFSPSERPRPRL